MDRAVPAPTLLCALIVAACDAQVRIESEPETMGGQPPAADPCNAIDDFAACCEAECNWLNPHGNFFEGGCFSDEQDCSRNQGLCSAVQVCLLLRPSSVPNGECPPTNYALVETSWGVCLDECPADLPDLCYPGEGE